MGLGAMTKKILITILFASTIYGQDIGINGMLGLPQGEFKENVDRLGYGFNIQGTLGSLLPDVPFSLGLNIGHLVYGEESETRRLWPDVAAYVDVNRYNTITDFHILFQIDLIKGPFKPYLEGLFGGAYISTSTSVESDYTDEDLASTTNFDDFSWSYGMGGGLMFEIVEGDEYDPTVYLDLKMRYIFVSEAEYLKEGSIDIIGNDLYYDVSRSNMDLLTINLGVVISLP